MALDKRAKQIGEHTYEVTQLDAVRGRRVFVRFAKLMMPALSEASAAASEAKQGAAGEVQGVAAGRFLKALERVADAVTEEDVEFFCEHFAPSTAVRGGQYGSKAPQLESVFALHFAGEYLGMMEWLLFCFEVNFGSFFARLGLTRDTPQATAE